jgi:hypothetical protein
LTRSGHRNDKGNTGKRASCHEAMRWSCRPVGCQPHPTAAGRSHRIGTVDYRFVSKVPRGPDCPQPPRPPVLRCPGAIGAWGCCKIVRIFAAGKEPPHRDSGRRSPRIAGAYQVTVRDRVPLD